MVVVAGGAAVAGDAGRDGDAALLVLPLAVEVGTRAAGGRGGDERGAPAATWRLLPPRGPASTRAAASEEVTARGGGNRRDIHQREGGGSFSPEIRKGGEEGGEGGKGKKEGVEEGLYASALKGREGRRGRLRRKEERCFCSQSAACFRKKER